MIGVQASLDVLRSPAGRWRAIALVAVVAVFANALHVIFAPFFENTSLYGFRDWDQDSSLRYITALSLTRYHEFPWWHPWLCGGFSAWGLPEGANNLVSPYLPLYLAFPIQLAERLEVLLSTIAAIVFTYLLAGRVTRSAALRAFVAVAFAINGRWALQFTEGHMWHLQYAWVPIAFLFFDISLDDGKTRYAVYAGVVMAAMAYMGGIYPLPHAALALLLYSLLMAVAQRSWRPFAALAIAGATGIGFGAPKLFAIADVMSVYPRKITSPEAIGIGPLVSMFTDSTGSFAHEPLRMPKWGWHEYGIYVGVWITLAMVIGILGPSERGRPTALRMVGLVFLVLGCGSFSRLAPWALLHRLPVFSSQHVPSRFLMLAVLLLSLAFAALAARVVDRAVAMRPWLDTVLLIPVFLIAARIATVDVQSSKDAFSFKGPAAIEPSPQFHHTTYTHYSYEPDWHQLGRQLLLAMYANTGALRCYATPHELVPGAIAQDSPAYLGEAYLAEEGVPGVAFKRVTDWTPNGATVEYDGASVGMTLVYNMNYDPSWRANGRPALNYRGAVATVLTSSDGEVKFRYYPRTLDWGLLVFALTAIVSFGAPRLWGRRRRS